MLACSYQLFFREVCSRKLLLASCLDESCNNKDAADAIRCLIKLDNPMPSAISGFMGLRVFAMVSWD